MSSVYNDVDSFIKKYKQMWYQTDIYADLHLKKYTKQIQISNQLDIDSSIDKAFGMMNKIPENNINEKKWQKDIQTLIKQETKKFLSINNKELESIILDGFMQTADEFVTSVKEFDKSMTIIDIMQAIRNVWIMNLIQLIAGKKIEHTPSIFAYSTLYPYTDNFLDDPDISREEKILFNKRLRKRLEGIDVASAGINEQKIYDLISIIEKQYDRKQFKNVFDSILCIHNGQCKSLLQQKGQRVPYDNDILSISIEKGGTSVLTDAYLVCGTLDKYLSDFIFGFGFALQLIDDLQDVKDDLENSHMTIFSQTAKQYNLDNLTNKLINFILNGINFGMCNASPHTSDIKKLIVDNCILMIIQAVSKNRQYYSKAYIKHIQNSSPVMFSYLKKTNKKTSKKIKSLSVKLSL